jgi:hypothetical protein
LRLQHLSQGSADMPVLRVEVTWAWEATAAAGASRVVVVLPIETSAQEVTVTQDSAMVWVKDAEDRAILMERESKERVLRV